MDVFYFMLSYKNMGSFGQNIISDQFLFILSNVKLDTQNILPLHGFLLQHSMICKSKSMGECNTILSAYTFGTYNSIALTQHSALGISNDETCILLN